MRCFCGYASPDHEKYMCGKGSRKWFDRSLIGYQFKNNACNLGVEFSSSKDGLRIPHEIVEVIFVRILGSEQVFHEELSRGVVPLVSYAESVKIQISGHTRTISVEQFPIVPAFSLTVHKVQGLTLKRMILGSWSTKDYKAPSQSYDVMLSRVCELNSLVLLKKLKFAQVKRFIPSDDFISEMNRLEVLEKATILSTTKQK